MKKFSIIVLVFAGALFFFQTHQSSATPIPITGVDTTVSLTSFETLIFDLGILPLPLGSAEVTLKSGEPPAIVFPITGGTFFDNDDPAPDYALIEHNGSGLSLTSIGDFSVFLNLENFLIDTKQMLLFGDASDSSGPVGNLALFNISPTLSLSLTEGASDAINTVFGLGGVDLTPDEIGQASLNVAVAADNPVPEPTTMLLFGSGLVGLLGIGRKKFKK